jgi:hypothetical protein
MTVWNSITVRTRDHGPVVTRCPDWCTGDGHPDGGFRADIYHCGPKTTITVQTPRGPVELVALYLNQTPFAAAPENRTLDIITVLADGDSWPTDPASADWLAGELVNAARRLRPAVLALDAIRGGEHR